MIDGCMNTNFNVAFGAEIAAAATRHHLEPRLLAAVAAQETGGPGSDSGRNIVGDGGHGRGVFQIDDRWHAFARGGAAMDPARNAEYAAGLLESNLHRYGDLRSALSAYNAGTPDATGTRTDWGDGKPVGYADSVFRHYARLGGDAAAPTAGSATTPAPAGGTAAQPDARDAADAVGALRALIARFGAGGFQAAGAAADPALAPMAMPLSVPAYRPIPQPDARDRDLAPSSAGDDTID
ncbi:MAG TPA: transglycosylase SLT domain-containing protein [Candidatus Elarobacter sp.]